MLQFTRPVQGSGQKLHRGILGVPVCERASKLAFGECFCVTVPWLPRHYHVGHWMGPYLDGYVDVSLLL